MELHTEVSCRSPGGSKGRKGKGRRRKNDRAKYLEHLNPGDMRPQGLLQLSPVQLFIESIQEEGVGCIGVLQRLDAHAQALKFFNFTTEEEGVAAKVQRSLDYLRRVRKSFQAEKVVKERENIEAKERLLSS